MKTKKLPALASLLCIVAVLCGFSPARNILYAVPGFQLTDAEVEQKSTKNLKIIVNIPAYRLQLLQNGREIKRYRCRVGNLQKKTITGTGKVTQKFRPAIFRYSEGEKAGEIITHSRIMDFRNGRVVKTIKIPYQDICGLEINVGGRVSGQIIHSTTNPETLEYPHSSGCVGLSVEDMLDLYRRVPVGTPIRIIYEPVEFQAGALHFHPDIYGYGIDYEDRVRAILRQWKIPARPELLRHLVERGRHFRRISLREIEEMASAGSRLAMQKGIQWF